MASVLVEVDVVGLDPTSTTANKSTNKLNPPKVALQVLTFLTIVLSYSAILHAIIPFSTRILGMVSSITCLVQPAASFKRDRPVKLSRTNMKEEVSSTILLFGSKPRRKRS